MRMSKHCVIFSLLILSICYGITIAADSPCGDWEPYKDEKCIKIINKTQTYDDAIKTCQQQENSSTLIFIRSLEEQEFFYNLLFKTHKVVDEVWIGAKYISNKFKWADDTDVGFTNWAQGSPSNTANKACVQMTAEVSSMGKWSDEPCNKKNLVVCQKMQSWSFSQMQKIVLGLVNNPVPVGFIYVQLPSQPEPKTLWPMVEWKDVTSNYAGLFFRAEGGSAAPFGTLQNGNVPYRYIDAVEHHLANIPNQHVNLPTSGWSDYIIGGGRATCCDLMRFHVSEIGGEVRPINKAVRMWKRSN